MKCPLMKIARGAALAGDVSIDSSCMKGECAWYDNANEQCCIKTLSQPRIKVSGVVTTHPA